MAEYIEREKIYADISRLLIDKSTADLTNCEDGWTSAISEAMDIIKNAPSADVRPERHGGWLVSGDCYECSECGGGSVVNTNPYCWKCGAKMDGKDGNCEDNSDNL